MRLSFLDRWGTFFGLLFLLGTALLIRTNSINCKLSLITWLVFKIISCFLHHSMQQIFYTQKFETFFLIMNNSLVKKEILRPPKKLFLLGTLTVHWSEIRDKLSQQISEILPDIKDLLMLYISVNHQQSDISNFCLSYILGSLSEKPETKNHPVPHISRFQKYIIQKNFWLQIPGSITEICSVRKYLISIFLAKILNCSRKVNIWYLISLIMLSNYTQNWMYDVGFSHDNFQLYTQVNI